MQALIWQQLVLRYVHSHAHLDQVTIMSAQQPWTISKLKLPVYATSRTYDTAQRQYCVYWISINNTV